MFTVRAPNRTHSGISAGVSFVAGVGHTDNPAALAYFAKAGYQISLEADAPLAAVAAPTVSDLDPLSAMTRAALVQLAKSIGLKGSGTSADLIDHIRAERSEAPVAAPPDADPFAPGVTG